MSVTPGWQQPARQPKPIGCLHLAVMVATLTLYLHDVGHEYICSCGKRFVVVDGGDGKRFVPGWK